MVPELRTPRLVLRAHHIADAPGHFALHEDPLALRWIAREPLTLHEAHKRLTELLGRIDAGEVVGWAMTKDGTWIGGLGFHSFDRKNDMARIGYEMLPSYWGQGLMQEALRRIMPYGFTELGLHRVEAHTAPENERSIRLLERLGFRREGVLRESYKQGDRWLDTALYARLGSDPG